MTLTVSDLPLVNALLNSGAAVCLLSGYAFIRRGRVSAHRNCMLIALTLSVLFLGSYLYYHYSMQRLHGQAHTRFVNPAWFRPIYLTILITHLIAAIVIVPMIIVTVTRALRQRFDQHRRIARWTWPLWMYVSVTGVVIYLLLYRVFPQR
jgi:putative membrane protein